MDASIEEDTIEEDAPTEEEMVEKDVPTKEEALADGGILLLDEDARALLDGLTPALLDATRTEL
jgi:hypothetical protein